jgi:uncharacterized cupin superfamily protein
VDDICLPHDHDFMEIALIVEGSGRHCSVQGEQALKAGDVFVLRPGCAGIPTRIVADWLFTTAAFR